MPRSPKASQAAAGCADEVGGEALGRGTGSRAHGVIGHGCLLRDSAKQNRRTQEGGGCDMCQRAHDMPVILTAGRQCCDSAAEEAEALRGANTFGEVTHPGCGRVCPLVDSWTISAFVFLTTSPIFTTGWC